MTVNQILNDMFHPLEGSNSEEEDDPNIINNRGDKMKCFKKKIQQNLYLTPPPLSPSINEDVMNQS